MGVVRQRDTAHCKGKGVIVAEWSVVKNTERKGVIDDFIREG